MHMRCLALVCLSALPSCGLAPTLPQEAAWAARLEAASAGSADASAASGRGQQLEQLNTRCPPAACLLWQVFGCMIPCTLLASVHLMQPRLFHHA